MKKRTVEITVPVYNEEKELEENIQKLADFCEKNLSDHYDWQITVADNASSDNTPIIASTIEKKNSRVKLFRLEEKGRGRAVKRAGSNTTCDFCVFTDLDLSTDLNHLRNLLKALGTG